MAHIEHFPESAVRSAIGSSYLSQIQTMQETVGHFVQGNFLTAAQRELCDRLDEASLRINPYPVHRGEVLFGHKVGG